MSRSRLSRLVSTRVYNTNVAATPSNGSRYRSVIAMDLHDVTEYLIKAPETKAERGFCEKRGVSRVLRDPTGKGKPFDEMR